MRRALTPTSAAGELGRLVQRARPIQQSGRRVACATTRWPLLAYAPEHVGEDGVRDVHAGGDEFLQDRSRRREEPGAPRLYDDSHRAEHGDA